MKRAKHIDTSEVLASERLMKALAGVTLSQFYNLASTLSAALIATKEEVALPRTELKLFFILFYLKVHPNTKLMAFIFKIPRARVTYWINKLKPLIPETLVQHQKHKREPISSLWELVELVPEIIAICDADHVYKRPELLDCFVGKFLQDRMKGVEVKFQ